MIRVLIYNEFLHEREGGLSQELYPQGIHRTIQAALETDEEITVTTTTLEDCEQVITEENLKETDVMIWWGHIAHVQVPDAVAERVAAAVHCGMGAIFLHSAHHSKPFRRLMGTPCNLTWRENGDYELVWVCDPSHPIAAGLGRFLKLEHEETYGEPFTVPDPDHIVFLGAYEGGEAFRSGCCWQRGYGKVFYFQPGHETVPTFHHPDVQRILRNAVHWAAPVARYDALACPNVERPLG